MEGKTSTRSTSARRPLSSFAVIAALLALALALLAVLSSFGAKWGWWTFQTGFGMLRISAFGGLASAVLSLIAIYITRPGSSRRGLPFAVLGLVVGLATFIVLWQVQRMAQSVPPIHDITTDVDNPPQFDAIVPLRADAPNPTEYGGAEIAEQQQVAYPDIRPLVLGVPPERAFTLALDAARAMGWEIVAADSATGRIEATDETFWYGFEDDVVVRLHGENDATVLDVRSVSRVGRGDLGVNARRIRDYLREVEERL